MRRRWVYVNGEAYEVSPEVDTTPLAPMVMPDIKPYRSMCDGSMITSRSHHREHLKAHGVIEIGNETKHMRRKEMKPPPGLKDTVVRLVNEKLR